MKKMIAAIMNVALAVIGLSLYAQNVGLTGQLDRWEGRTDAIFTGDERSPVIQVGAHAELTAVFGPVPATIFMLR